MAIITDAGEEFMYEYGIGTDRSEYWPHRWGMTQDEAEEWLADALADGCPEGMYMVIRRRVGEWESYTRP